MRLLSFYNNLKIANKLTFYGISSSLIAGFIIVTLLYVFQYFYERDKAVNDSKIFAKILADNISPLILTNDTQAISTLLASVEYHNDISKTFAFDTSWKMLGAFHKGNDFVHQTKMIPLIKENQNLWSNGFFYSVVPILNNEKKIGNLVVVVSLENFYIRMIKVTFSIFIIVLVSLLITSRFRKILHDSILKPISELDTATTQIIKTKNMSHTIPILNNDEIGSLAKKFQNMLNELDLHHKELNSQKEILSYQSTHDSLTKLPNRALFQERLNQSIVKSKRSNEKFALFFIDLDQFKEINDTFGHDYGDKLLLEISTKLKSIIREGDTLARLGGDEFTVIMNNIHAYHDASILAEKILGILKTPIELENEQLVISCSIGISIYPKDAKASEELVKNADIAMYRSKADGRNTYNFYEHAMTKEILARVSMQAKIREALENKDFSVYYQPQYDLLKNKIIGFEALVRWFDKDGTLTYPDSFIPLAEELGLVVGINHQVMRTAMLQLKSWYDNNLNPGKISINISVVQIEDTYFSTFIQKLLLDTGCKAEWLILELTEGQLMKNPVLAMKVLKELTSLGIKIAIDDFGTGYSSLAYLKYLSINEIKIDKSFINDIETDPDDVAIVSAIIALASSLGIDTIAEGVETKAQEKFLISQKCYKVQGYLYSRPISADEATKLLI